MPYTVRPPTGHPARAPSQPRALPLPDAAWLLALPAALLTTIAVLVLGPPLGSALFAPEHARFVASGARPEPTEHARYAIAAAAPFVLAAVLALRGRTIADTPTRRAAARAAGGLLLAFVLFALVAQHVLAYRGATGELYPQHRIYFTPATLVLAALIAAVIAAALRRPALVERLQAATRETHTRRLVATAVALALIAAWLLTAFNTEGTIGRADPAVAGNIPFWLDETFALLNGLTPLSTFHAQYGQLWPFATAGAMALLGPTIGVYTGVTVAAIAGAMLAVFATFRRVVGSSLIALMLFAPFIATSFFKEQGMFSNRYGPSNLFSLFPIRYGGPLLLAWLLARRLDGARPRSAGTLYFVAGLVTFNNPEFGVPAFAATLAALVWTLPQKNPRALAKAVGAALAGLAGALALVSLVTLTAAGTLPHLGQLTEFSRIYAVDGFGMLPMPAFGFHLAIYVTFAAALVLATVRTIQRQRDALLTGLLCWIGVFGLGAGGYYAGRSHPEVLIDLFAPWAFALALLLVAVVRAIVARTRRVPTAAELAVLLGFALAICSIAQTPTPWSQIARLQRTTTAPRFRSLAIERFVRQHTSPGEHVLILLQLGHRIAYDTGVQDVLPYANLDSMLTTAQWDAAFAAANAAHVHTAFVPTQIKETNLIARAFNTIVVNDFRRAGFSLAPVRAPPSLNVTVLRR